MPRSEKPLTTTPRLGYNMVRASNGRKESSVDPLWAPWRMSYIMAPKPDDCIFCTKPAAGDDRANLIVWRGDSAYVMLNAYPYNNGHLPVSYTHLRAHETVLDLVCRLLLEKK